MKPSSSSAPSSRPLPHIKFLLKNQTSLLEVPVIPTGADVAKITAAIVERSIIQRSAVSQTTIPAVIKAGSTIIVRAKQRIAIRIALRIERTKIPVLLVSQRPLVG